MLLTAVVPALLMMMSGLTMVMRCGLMVRSSIMMMLTRWMFSCSHWLSPRRHPSIENKSRFYRSFPSLTGT
jgi:hypothetical protein